MTKDNSTRTYIGLTIGPIIETISNAKETGELWAGSYLFSYIMKNIINNLIKADNTLKDRFIVPFVDNKEIFSKAQEVGLFHDRFIFESNKGDFELVEHAINDVKKNIVNEIRKIKCYKESNYDDKIRKCIEDFLKIYYLEVEVDIKGEKDENNIIFKVSKCLDALELREKLPSEKGIERNYLLDVLNNSELKKDNFKKHFLSKDAYGEKGKENGYPSLFKIALAQTDKKDFPCDDEEIREKILEEGLQKDLLKAHEYVAVIQVDGDFMGKVISNFKINEDKENIYKNYKDFSEKLLDYSKESHEIIENYGGFTVYAGGDDLLFIAPIINKKQQNENAIREETIFDLINSLSDLFEEKFKDYKPKPTTSFGVAMVHHKFPLYYALDEARELLFEKAKNYKINEKEKNAIAFKVIKSSGQSFETVVGKNSESYKQFKDLFKNVDSKNENKEIKNYLKAIHFKLIKDKVILNKIGKDRKLLENYFNNNFDEKIHKTEPIKAYIENLIEFIYQIYNEMKNDADKDKCINQIYSYLRFIKFMDEDIRLDDWTIKEKGEKNE